MAIETCANCGRTIGNLEQHFVWQDNIVCLECDARLRKQAMLKTEENNSNLQHKEISKILVEEKKAKAVVVFSEDAKETPISDVGSKEVVDGVIDRERFSTKEISSWKFIFYALGIAGSILLLDMIGGFYYKKAAEQISNTFLVVGLFVLYIGLGIWITEFIYKLRRLFWILGLSLFVLVVLRLVVLFILIETETLDKSMIFQAMQGTALEVIIVFPSVIIFSFLFRFVEPKFRYAEISNIISPSDDHDMGTCAQCGMRTIIAKKRFISLLGKSEKHFCDNCGIFLRNNPFKAIFLGLTECTVAFIWVIEGAVNNTSSTSGSSNTQNVFILIMACAIYDGINRLIAGMRGVVASHSPKNVKVLRDSGNHTMGTSAQSNPDIVFNRQKRAE
jgi:hypothetical protein